MAPGRAQSRMFHIPTAEGLKVMRTWNVFVGCSFFCTYCNARKLALTRLKNSPRYQHGFEPHLVEEELNRKFQPGDFVFVSYMGEIAFASWDIIMDLLHRISSQPQTNFLFCTKNPLFYSYGYLFPENLYLGATIETTENLGLSKAPDPWCRYLVMKYLPHPKKFISIEPICDFDLDTMLKWMDAIKPQIIELGADNYHSNLPEPAWEKVEKLLRGLKDICPTVVEKVGLHRLENCHK